MAELLRIRDLRIEFPSRRGHVVAVSGVSLSLRKGEVLGIVGESGAGKSTIGNAVVGLLEPPGQMTAGDIYLAERRIDDLSETKKRAIRGAEIGMIFQDPLTSLNPLETVQDQLVETMLQHLDLTLSAAQDRAVQLLERVGIADAASRALQYPHQFSGGMRQRVVIALAICAEPAVVIADEPTTALDVSIQAQILELLRGLCRDREVGMMIITHDMGVIADVTDRIAVMYNGRVVEEGETAQILGEPNHPYTQSLIAAVPRPDRRLRRFPSVSYIEAEVKPRKQIDLNTHWLGQSRQFVGQGAQDDRLIRLEGLQYRFLLRNSFRKAKRLYTEAVRNVSLDIREGEVFGLVGESGSGKSTIARLIAGLYVPSQGRILFAGQDLNALGSSRELNLYRRQMQMIFQDPFSSLNPRMRVRSIVAEPIRFHRIARDVEEERQVVLDLLDHVGLGEESAERYPHEFSGGQRQRISIARALATRPRFLICDEPTSALDVSIQAQILNLLKDLQQELGLTILFISHDLPVIRQMCDRCAVMRDGEICEIANIEALFTAPTHPYTRHLLGLMPKLDHLAQRTSDTTEPG